MFHAPDGKLRFAPKDLVSYLEGDFATELVNLLCYLVQHAEEHAALTTRRNAG